MSPRAGGESDKFGNRYEGAWTVYHLLLCLAGQGISVTVEDVGEVAEAAEFTFVRSNGREVHQVKRQNGNAASWTVSSIHAQGMWNSIAEHVKAGREFHFVSLTPAATLRDLADRARRSASVDVFDEKGWLTNDDLRNAFTSLGAEHILGSSRSAWETLRGLHLAWPDERQIVLMNSALAGHLLSGASGRLAAAGLADIALQNLGVELTAARLAELLPAYGLELSRQTELDRLSNVVDATTSSWLYRTGISLFNPAIERAEATAVVDAVRTELPVTFVVGLAGSGKTAVLHQSVSKLRDAGISVLAFRMDRLENFANTEELGARLGFPGSPVTALAASSASGESVLVIDQLDAVSLASGRMPHLFDIVVDVIKEASVFPGMHVLLACRQFDLESDHRIADLAENQNRVTVGELPSEQIEEAVSSIGFSPSLLTAGQRALLALPFNLALLAAVARDPDALNFDSVGGLLDHYWDRKRRDVTARKPRAKFDSAMNRIALEISRRQRLSVSRSVIDQAGLADETDILISEHVLTQDGREIAFFHESLFDYTFARYWITLGIKIVEFLMEGEQEMFRRQQVRQILNFLRNETLFRFTQEVGELLESDNVRFHIKQLVLETLGTLDKPGSQDVSLLVSVANAHPEFAPRVWAQMRNSRWLACLDSEGYIDLWLSDSQLRGRVFGVILGAARDSPDSILCILARYRSSEEYPALIRNITSVSRLERSRDFIEVLLEDIKNGHFCGYENDLWIAVYSLREKNASWALDVLSAYFTERAEALIVDEHGRIVSLSHSSHYLAEIIRCVARFDARNFCSIFVPYVLAVSELTLDEDSGYFGWRNDRHFSGKFDLDNESNDTDETILVSLVFAIQLLAAEDIEVLWKYIDKLEQLETDTAQFLLYQSYIAVGNNCADRAARTLLQTESRLFCGCHQNSVWITRVLLLEISESISNDLHAEIEEMVRDVTFPWEGKRKNWYAFTLLSALADDKLSSLGKRRLSEYQRRFQAVQPDPPTGVISGWVSSPIPEKAFRHMSDENWLQAMDRHVQESTNWDSFKGGARELAMSLKNEVTLDPGRFAEIALRMGDKLNPAYGEAILLGFAEADQLANPEVLFNAVRHIAKLQNNQNDRWVGGSLTRYLDVVPIDLVELVLQLTLDSIDPADDQLMFSSSADERISDRLRMTGLNSARGANALALADMVLRDPDGSRTALVAARFEQFADESTLAVRSCLGDVLAASYRRMRAEVRDTFWRLIDTNDVLLSCNSIQQVLVYIGNDDPEIARPVVERMLASAYPEVREHGGRLAAYAGLEWGYEDLLSSSVSNTDALIRAGVARSVSRRILYTSNRIPAENSLKALFYDSDDYVRECSASVAAVLRGQPLRPNYDLISSLILSPTYGNAASQLFITFDRAPDRISDLIISASVRFIELYGLEIADISTSAAADSHHISDLVLRGLAQSDNPAERAALLDIVDKMLLFGAYGIEGAVENAQR